MDPKIYQELLQAENEVSNKIDDGSDYLKKLDAEINPVKQTAVQRLSSPEFQAQGQKFRDFIRGVGGDILKPVENTVRTAVAPVVAGGKSLVKGTDFRAEYENVLEKYKTAPSVTSIVSNGQSQATGRDLKDEKLQALGDLVQSVPIVKGAKIAKTVGGAVSPILGKAAGTVAAGTVPGYMLDVGTGLTEGENVNESLKPGLATGISAAIPLAPYLLRAAGSITKKAAEKGVSLVMPKSTQEAQILQAYKASKSLPERLGNILKGESISPQGVYKTTVEKGLMGTKSMIGIQAKRAQEKLWKNLIEPRLKDSEFKVDLPKFMETVKSKIIANNDDLGRQKALLEALDAVKDDYKGVSQVGLEQLQKYKEGWAKFVPEKAYRGKPIAGLYNDVRNELAKEARETIYSSLGDDVKQAYFDYGNLKGLEELGLTSMTAQKLKGGNFAGITEILSQLVTPIGTMAGRAIYKLGNGMEIVGKAGAKTLEEALELNPQVLSQPTNTLKDQTMKSQNNIVPSVSNMSDTIPQEPKIASVKNFLSDRKNKKMSGFAQLTRDSDPSTFKIHPEDADILNDFAQVVRGTSKTSQSTLIKMREELAPLIERYGIPVGKSDKALADNILRALYNEYHKMPGFAELGFLPKLGIGTAVGAGGIKAITSSKE